MNVSTDQGYDVGDCQVLMPPSSVARAEDFESRHVIPTVVQSWTQPLIDDFRNYASRFHMNDTVRAKLHNKFQVIVCRGGRMGDDSVGRGKILNNLVLCGAFLGGECEQKWQESQAQHHVVKADRELKRRESAMQAPDQTSPQHLYRRLMPQRFATDLILKFRLKPGKMVRSSELLLPLILFA